MLRRSLATFAMVIVLAASAGPAAALNNMGITPATQSHAHGLASNWTATWGGQATFDEHFSYGVQVPPLALTDLAGAQTLRGDRPERGPGRVLDGHRECCPGCGASGRRAHGP